MEFVSVQTFHTGNSRNKTWIRQYVNGKMPPQTVNRTTETRKKIRRPLEVRGVGYMLSARMWRYIAALMRLFCQLNRFTRSSPVERTDYPQIRSRDPMSAANSDAQCVGHVSQASQWSVIIIISVDEMTWLAIWRKSGTVSYTHLTLPTNREV